MPLMTCNTKRFKVAYLSFTGQMPQTGLALLPVLLCTSCAHISKQTPNRYGFATFFHSIANNAWSNSGAFAYATQAKQMEFPSQVCHINMRLAHLAKPP